MGTILKDSELKNFAKFFDQIYMDYSRKHKTAVSTAFDEQFGKRLVEEFGNKTLKPNHATHDRELLSRTAQNEYAV